MFCLRLGHVGKNVIPAYNVVECLLKKSCHDYDWQDHYLADVNKKTEEEPSLTSFSVIHCFGSARHITCHILRCTRRSHVALCHISTACTRHIALCVCCFDIIEYY
jgi:hypothetical protein